MSILSWCFRFTLVVEMISRFRNYISLAVFDLFHWSTRRCNAIKGRLSTKFVAGVWIEMLPASLPPHTHTHTHTHVLYLCTYIIACLSGVLGYSFVLIIIKWSLAFTHKGCKPACASFTNIFPEFRSPNLHHSSRKTVKRYQYLSQIRSNKVIKPANKNSIPCHVCRRPIIIVFITIEDAAAAAWAHTCFFGIWNRELGIWNWDSGFWVWVIKIISLICRLDLVPNKSAAWVLEIWILDSGNSGFRQINSLCLPPCVCVCGCGCNL